MCLQRNIVGAVALIEARNAFVKWNLHPEQCETCFRYCPLCTETFHRVARLVRLVEAILPTDGVWPESSPLRELVRLLYMRAFEEPL